MRPARALVAVVATSLACACGSRDGAAPPLIPAQPPPPALRETSLRDHVVRGRILGADGAPLALAHAHLVSEPGEHPPVESVQAGRDGTFTLPITRAESGAPFAVVELSGVDHRVETLVVALDEAVEVEVKLGTYKHATGDDPPSLMVVAPDGRRSRHALSRRPDGTYVADVSVKDGLYGYEIMGLTVEGHTINGSTLEDGGFRYDGDGDYESLVNVSGGRLHVEYDPGKRPPSGVPGSVKFADASSVSAGLTEIFRHVEAERHAAVDEGTKDLGRRLLQIAESAKSPSVRRAANVAYFDQRSRKEAVTDEDRARARRLVDEAAEAKPFWGFFPDALPRLLEAAGESPATTSLRRAIIDTHPSRRVVAGLLVHSLMSDATPLEERREMVKLLRGSRFDGTIAQMQAELLDPDRVLAPGKTMPEFELPALPGAARASAPITRKSLEGKVYLIDVWATWCKPCIAELPFLHELHAKYGTAPDRTSKRKKSLSIVSLSVDDDAEKVTAFRKDKAHPMPWQHAWAGGGAKSEATLVALGGKPSFPIPMYVLVDDKGTIVRASPELSLRALPELLDQLLQ